MANLTERQRKFKDLAIEYETEHTRAYMEAYDIPIERIDTAQANCSRLLRNATIADAIQKGILENRQRREKIRAKAEEKIITRKVASRERVLEKLTEILENDKPVKIDGKVIIPKVSDQIAAGKLIMEYEYPNTQRIDLNANISTTDNLQSKIDELAQRLIENKE